MKTTCLFLVSLFCFGMIRARAAPQLPPRYFVVCITEMDKTEQYEVMSADDLKQLTDEVKAEESFFPKAVECARAEWMKDEALKRKIFPKSAVYPRKVEAMGPSFADQEKAQKKILQLCEQVSSFYQLEQLYKDELARLDPSGRSGKTTMECMRSRVEELGEFKRPTMTTGEVNKIRSEWSR